MNLQVEHNRKYRLHRPQEIIKSSVFKNSRSIYLKQKLLKGRYIAVMCTFEPGIVGEFLFRLYSGPGSNAR